MPPVDRLIAAAQAGQVAEVRSLVTARAQGHGDLAGRLDAAG